MLKIYRLNKKQNTFEVTLKYKGVGVHVSFVDGNTYNNTPARCHTSDSFKQRAIEASQMFKDKEITLERVMENKNEHKKEPDPKAVAKTPVKKVVKQPVTPPVKQPVTSPVTTDTKDADPPLSALADGETREFANLGEAILFIAQNYQQEAKTEKEAREILKAHGINPKIKKG